MRLRISRPSPAMVVALVALVMATTGSAVAAVNYARNAGAVDGKSAVSAGASLTSAKGRLVATAKGGENAGRIPGKFVADVVYGETFGRAQDVVDNAVGGATELNNTTGFGPITASCTDQDPAAGREDPRTVITYTNRAGDTVNVARRTGNSPSAVRNVANGTVEQFDISGSNTFTLHLERGGTNVLIDGAVRQDGAKSGSASCLVFGVARLVR